ncbi:benzoate--coa ligase peroxisomal [Phtheirospermum japonicum]|uniref:Benzoate--coa ligase peroxisomal n=1 Tax=Phtheirospermum japonicum TaxID=374723 RepID=A0A830DAA3_9LAMI|nr:benzoate--coa ligase peroxisomal [Phtheirospermum japonicum]
MDKLPKCGANYVPLTPVTFLKRAANVYSNRTSIIHGAVRFTWRQTYERCCRLASALKSLSIVKNNVVSVLAPNIPAIYEMHFAVPMSGAVLNTINTRLDAKNIATILTHSEAKVFFIDYEYVPVARDALRLLMADGTSMPLVVVIDNIAGPTGIRLAALEYEQLVSRGNPGYTPEEITDEWDPIALNYTLSLILGWGMQTEPVYLWSLPMFHCNGWTFPWGVAARGGTNVCIRNTTASEIYGSIASHKVTHMCCAPIVFNILLEAKPRPLARPVEILTGGAPPSTALLERIESLGFHVVHAYGLTEATGPALVCEWQSQWDNLGQEDRAGLKARQGISILTLADVDVKDPETMESVARKNMAGFMVPKIVKFMEGLPKTSTGKIQKFQLRALANTFDAQNETNNWELPTATTDHETQISALSRL